MLGAQAIGVFKNFRKGQWVFIASQHKHQATSFDA